MIFDLQKSRITLGIVLAKAASSSVTGYPITTVISI